MKALQGKPIIDVGKGLRGVVPGLTITYANGGINTSPVMNIRGMGSINASNGGSPLIIVDNVVVSDISTTGLIVDANMYIQPYATSSFATRVIIDPKHYLDAIPTGVKNLYDLKGVDFTQNPGW